MLLHQKGHSNHSNRVFSIFSHGNRLNARFSISFTHIWLVTPRKKDANKKTRFQIKSTAEKWQISSFERMTLSHVWAMLRSKKKWIQVQCHYRIFYYLFVKFACLCQSSGYINRFCSVPFYLSEVVFVC